MASVTPDAYINETILQRPEIGRDVQQVKMALIKTSAAAAQGDTYTFDMSKLGGTTLLGLYTVWHEANNSDLRANAITTTVSGTTITFTIPAAGGTKARATKIYFK